MRVERVVIFGAAAIVGIGISIFYRAHMRDHDTGERLRNVNVAAPVKQIRIEHSGTYWARQGFVEMSAPVRAPTTADGQTHILVYLKLPEHGVVHTRANASAADANALEYPVGTIADRVEYFSKDDVDAPAAETWLAADVRGTELTSSGAEYHMLRPETSQGGGDLLGFAWPASDPIASREATRAVGSMIEQGMALGPTDPAARMSSANHLMSLNDCQSCHQPSRPPRLNIGSPGGVNRGTDRSGFFQISTVLVDRAPLEEYRPKNANGGDPFLRFVCGSNEVPAVMDHDAMANVHCAGGEIPVGVLDLRAGIRAGDLHAAHVCAARRFLYSRLDETGQKLFADSVHECD